MVVERLSMVVGRLSIVVGRLSMVFFTVSSSTLFKLKTWSTCFFM